MKSLFVVVSSVLSRKYFPFKFSNIQTRTLTVILIGPLIFFLIVWSDIARIFILFACMFIGGIEWSGLKRHLKVELILGDVPGGCNACCKNYLADWSVGCTEVESTPTSCATSNGIQKNIYTSNCLLGVPQLHCKLSSLEHLVPVTSLGFYNILKHFGWSFLVLAASYGEAESMLVFSFFFVTFVCFTIVAHNHLEKKIEQNIKRLSSHLQREIKESLINDTNYTLDTTALKEAQRQHFLLRELHMIAEKQPTEQFIDFSLDIFGIIWLSGLLYPLFLFNLPRLGLPWFFSTLLGNFSNDIAALIFGKSFSIMKRRIACNYDITIRGSASKYYSNSDTIHKDQTLKTEGVRKSISEAPFQVRTIMKIPHHLNALISPNKSVEGAFFGILVNAIVFTTSMCFWYRYESDYPDAKILSPVFQSPLLWFVIGLFMGVFGVIGDLLQSLLKRAARVKDAGFIIPGHGGILDRLDGALLTFPFMYVVLGILRALS